MNLKLIVAVFFLFFVSGEAFSQRANTSRSTGRARISSTKKKLTEDDVIGSWKLVKFKHGPQSKKRRRLTPCDTLMPWVFYRDSVYGKLRLKCEAIEGCEDYGFECEWIFNMNSLILKKTRIMGSDGISSNGKFKIKELNKTQMVLDFMKHIYVFQRVE